MRNRERKENLGKILTAVFCLVLLFAFAGVKAEGQIAGSQSSVQDEQRSMENESPAENPRGSNLDGERMDSLVSYLARRETAMRLAAFTRNYYVALVKNGFSEKEALQIVIYSGIPALFR